MLCKNRCVRNSKDGYKLLQQFLCGDVDREYFVMSLNVWIQRINQHLFTFATLKETVPVPTCDNELKWMVPP